MTNAVAKEFFVPETPRRLWAYGIDQLIVVILFLPLWARGFGALIMGDELVISIPVFLVLIFFPALYDFLFVAFMGRTPGKWFLNMWVVPVTDVHQSVTWMQALLRALVARLSLFFSWAIFCVAFFRYDRTHLCDWIAETRVVQEKAPDRRFKLHPVFACVLILFYLFEGLAQATRVLGSVNFETNQVEVSKALGGPSMEDSDDVEEID